MLDNPMQTLTDALDEVRRLLNEARIRDGRSWEVIGAIAGVPGPTIRGWVREGSTVKDLPLLGVIRVARVLGLSADEVAARAYQQGLTASAEELLRDLEEMRDRPEGSGETDSDAPPEG